MNLQDIGLMLQARNRNAVPSGLENMTGGSMAQANVFGSGAGNNAGRITRDKHEYDAYQINFMPTEAEPEPLQFEAWRARKYGAPAPSNPYKRQPPYERQPG